MRLPREIQVFQDALQVNRSNCWVDLRDYRASPVVHFRLPNLAPAHVIFTLKDAEERPLELAALISRTIDTICERQEKWKTHQTIESPSR